MNRTVLLTGATGFLGSHTLPALLTRGHRVIALVRASSDLSRIAPCADKTVFVDIDSAPLEQIMVDNGIDTVVHLACDQGRGSDDIDALLTVNLMLGIRLLQAARSCGVTVFLNADTQLEAGVNAYALSKKQFTAWLPYFSDEIAISNLRLGNIYGPREPASGFLSWLLTEFTRGADRVELTPGAQLRDFVHAADVSAAILAVLDHSHDAGLKSYDTGSGELLSLRTFVEMAQAVYQRETGAMRSQLIFGALEYRPGEIMQPKFDTAALFDLGWRPGLTLEEGLTDTVRAFLDRELADAPK
jgi:nucleoside-diphosphate-sugar epimerase